GFLILLLMIVWISRSITRPLTALSGVTAQIARGDLEAPIPEVKTGDEVSALAESFRRMTTSLKQYIFDLRETTAAKERIESELKIAHDIQMGFLPKKFPPFPGRTDFDILARIEPAREVGGDLYDFFFIDENHLCFLIGDVSGKGVPSSLFMAVTSTLIKGAAAKGLSPETVLTHVNRDLCRENDSMMFVTLFLGMLDTRTGELGYCNAGHNPPLIIAREGSVLPLQPTGDIALGVTEDAVYHRRKITLQEGDSVFLYTDGVTEAMNKKEELFSEGRLIAELAATKAKPLQDIVAGIMEKVGSFSAGVPQTDDITVMAIRYNGKFETDE
ncbi:MAG TPA: SpoIIE family protein phosphatase, partial [Thermodesulfobacteriota bacterium]|nr:SpoIIE family protein phosphatase [Thermodesulfobacteriota bacterium]